MTGFESLKASYYDNHSLDSLDCYVTERFLNNSAEKERMEKLISLVPKEVESLLDVGAGFGLFLHGLGSQRDILSEGVDVSKESMRWGLNRGLKLQLASAHELPYGDQAFDMITCSEVLEHLTWGVYEESLREIARVAGRYVLISVPYDEKRGFAKCPYCGCKANPDYHMRSFDSSSLKGLIPGFELVNVETICRLSIIYKLRPYLPLPWHAKLVCPACNYRDTKETDFLRSSRLAKVKALLRGFPLPTVPRWIAGLYRRS